MYVADYYGLFSNDDALKYQMSDMTHRKYNKFEECSNMNHKHSVGCLKSCWKNHSSSTQSKMLMSWTFYHLM